MAKRAAGMAGGADKAEDQLAAEDHTNAGALGMLKERIAAAIGEAREAGVAEQDILAALEEEGEKIDDALQSSPESNG
jgi:hypothetical protein